MNRKTKVYAGLALTAALLVATVSPAQAATWWSGYKDCGSTYVKMLDSSNGPTAHFHQQDILWYLNSFPTAGIHASSHFHGLVWNELRKDSSVSVQNFSYYCYS